MTDDVKHLFGIARLKESKAGSGRFIATGAYSELFGGLTKDVDGTDHLGQFSLDVEPTTAVAALRGPGGQGLYVNSMGEGFAIFCSTLTWHRWALPDPLYRRLHQALFARHARIELLSSDDGPDESCFSRGCEVAKFANGYALQNRTDSPVVVHVEVDGKEHRHELGVRRVVLIRDGKEITLGTGIMKVETGQK